MATSPKGLGPEKGYLARASSIYKDRHVPSSERGHYKNNTITVKE
jgi:hypothetical protein